MTATEQKSALTLAMMAAFSDGEKSEVERSALKQMVESFGATPSINLFEAYQDALGQRRPLSDIAAELTSPAARQFAYEAALGVCESDGPLNPREQAFLAQLRTALHTENAPLSLVTVDTPPSPAATLPAVAAVASSANSEAIDKMVLNYAILNGALELLPQNLATMAIVPLQMKMVYRIGQRHGYSLDRGHIRDFLATAGLGLGAQAVENLARKLVGNLAGNLLGGLGRGMVKTGTGAAFTFASTYAIGQLANRYYAGGRTMSSALLRDTYTKLADDGRRLFGQHESAIATRARTLSPTEIMNLARGGEPSGL